MRVQNRVKQLLEASRIYRDSDKKLLLAYWHTQGLHLTDVQRDIFMGCTPAESITRARRDLKYLFPASKAVDDARYQKYKQFSSPHAVSWLND